MFLHPVHQLSPGVSIWTLDPLHTPFLVSTHLQLGGHGVKRTHGNHSRLLRLSLCFPGVQFSLTVCLLATDPVDAFAIETLLFTFVIFAQNIRQELVRSWDGTGSGFVTVEETQNEFFSLRFGVSVRAGCTELARWRGNGVGAPLWNAGGRCQVLDVMLLKQECKNVLFQDQHVINLIVSQCIVLTSGVDSIIFFLQN